VSSVGHSSGARRLEAADGEWDVGTLASYLRELLLGDERSPDVVLQEVARSIAAQAGGGALLLLRSAGEDALHVAAADHPDPTVRRILWRSVGTLVREPRGPGLIASLARGETVRAVESTPGALLRRLGPVPWLQVREARMRSLVAVPLRVDGYVVGAVCLTRHQAEPVHAEEDDARLSELCAEIAPAVERERTVAVADADDRAAPVPPAGGDEAEVRGAATATMALSDAVDALGVSASTLRRWADSGRVRVVRTAGGHRRFAVDDVRRLGRDIAERTPAVVRPARQPTGPLPAVAVLLDADGEELLDAAVRGVYEAGHPGWFAADAARPHLLAWLHALADAARGPADYDAACAATRELAARALYAGTSIVERHALLERLGDLVGLHLGERGASRHELIETRRLVRTLQRAMLAGAETPA
jgi:excisionase family DNA binding protein